MEKLEPGHALPLYQQIAEKLRYRIAVGALKPGTALPPIRVAAGQWGVNLHTVRHAYRELERAGIVQTIHPRGTFVAAVGVGNSRQGKSAKRLARFLERISADANRRFGLSSNALSKLLGDATLPHPSINGRILVVECSETQCADLAQQLQSAWSVDAEPWCLRREDEPPPGPMLATYFHYNDIRRRWPDRLSATRFIAIRPDPYLGKRIRDRLGINGGKLIVCECDESMARNIAADLSMILPPSRFQLEIMVHGFGDLPIRSGNLPVLYSPRVWGQLSPEIRANRRSFEIRYVFDALELSELGRLMGWRAADTAHAAGAKS